MKQGASINRIVMFLFFAAIVLYLGGATWKGLRDPYPTMPVYEYAVEDTVEATGYLVRREKVLTGSFGIVRLIPGEGEKVHAGATVALLYADQLSLERSQRLEDLQAETAQLTQAIAVGGVPRHIRGPVTGHGTENQLAALRYVLPALVQQTHAHIPDERHEHTPVLGEIGVFGNQLRVHAARGKRMVVIGDHRLEVVDAA